MAVFALLEDSLAFGALEDLPGAPTANMTMSPPAPIAAAPSVPSRTSGSAAFHHRALAWADLMESAVPIPQHVLLF